MTAEERALKSVQNINDVGELRKMLANVRGKSEQLERAVFEKLIDVAAGAESDDALARDLWKMVFAVEELRRMAGRPVWRMNRLRPKIESDGAAAALAYCAMNKTEGFDEVLSYGRPDLLAESIALRHADRISEEVLSAAKRRLAEHDLI